MSAVSGWAALILAEAVFVFLVPGRTPDLGYVGFFVLLVVVYSVPYFVFWSVVALPAFLLLRRRAADRSLLLWAACGAAFFGVAAVATDAVVRGGPSSDLSVEAVLAALAGSTSFTVFALFNRRSARTVAGSHALKPAAAPQWRP